MSTLLMDAVPEIRSSARDHSMLAACLRRCADEGIRILVTAPGDTRMFVRGLSRFPERLADPAMHAGWETAYRMFIGASRQPHDRGSWRVLAVDRDERIIGAITARFFCGEIVRDYVHAFALLEESGPVFREHSELAIAETFATAVEQDRTPAEISHCSVAPGESAPLVGATLIRAIAALAAAFEAPLAIVAADHRRGEVTRLMRVGAAPLGRAGKYSLPPFVHHATGAWLRLLLIDFSTYHLRRGARPAADLAALRQHCSVISAG